MQRPKLQLGRPLARPPPPESAASLEPGPADQSRVQWPEARPPWSAETVAQPQGRTPGLWPHPLPGGAQTTQP